jgi:hypothetical protein
MEYCVGKNGHIGIKCVMCDHVVEIPVTEDELLRWNSYKNSVQEQFPNLAPELREMFISGICPKCWNDLFPPEEEE